MENNGATPILIETATVPGTEAGEVRNADKDTTVDGVNSDRSQRFAIAEIDNELFGTCIF